LRASEEAEGADHFLGLVGLLGDEVPRLAGIGPEVVQLALLPAFPEDERPAQAADEIAGLAGGGQAVVRAGEDVLVHLLLLPGQQGQERSSLDLFPRVGDAEQIQDCGKQIHGLC
jgi:hypothetical protein